MTNKAKSRRRNGRNQALTSQEPHVPVNNFSLEELRRLFAETQTIPPTARPRQYVASRSTVIMPMADGTSLLRVIQRELARHGVGRAVESADDFESGAAETPDRKDTPVHGQAQRGRALEAPRPVQADDEPSRPSEAPGKVETRSAKSDATGTAAAPEVDHSLDVATPFRANNEPSRPSTERGEVETRPSKLKGKPATAAATPSKTIDPNKASMTLRLRGVFFQNDNDRFQENRVPLDEKIPQLQFQLQRLCSLLAHSDRLEAIARDNRCFHFRVRPDFTTDITRNFYIVDNEHSYCRLERVRDMFHTHQIEAAKRNGVPLMLKFYLAMEEGDRPGDELSRHSFQEQWAPQFGFYAMEWDEDEQGVRTCPMNPIVEDIPDSPPIQIYKDFTATPHAQGLNNAVQEQEQEQAFANIISQIPERHGEIRQPLMTFNRYDRNPKIAPTQPPTDLHLAIHLFTHLQHINCDDFAPPMPILLKIPATRTADKIKRALLQELQQYRTGRSLPQPRSEYKNAFEILLRDHVRWMWTLQLWAMPQDEEARRLHICRKKEDFRGFLKEGGGEGVYVEAHLVLSEEMG